MKDRTDARSPSGSSGRDTTRGCHPDPWGRYGDGTGRGLSEPGWRFHGVSCRPRRPSPALRRSKVRVDGKNPVGCGLSEDVNQSGLLPSPHGRQGDDWCHRKSDPWRGSCQVRRVHGTRGVSGRTVRTQCKAHGYGNPP